MTRLKVAILGANGQVGSELALLLSDAAVVDVRGVLRSDYGAALLRLAGLPYAVAGFDDANALAAALGDRDLVVDLTYPAGQLAEIPDLLDANMRAVMRAMRRGARYLHMSSIMAFGMPSGRLVLRDYRTARASYGYIKRWGERRAVRLGRAHGVETFVFRLGQVHGALQAVTQEYRARAESRTFRLTGEPGELSTTVFMNAVADAVLVCGRGEVEPGRTYTLVSNPQWTLAELGEVYARLYCPDLLVGYRPRPAGGREALALGRGLVLGPGVRDLMETQVFLRLPELFVRAKGQYRRRAVRGEASAHAAKQQPALDCLVGRVPGPLVPGIDSTAASAIRIQREVSGRLESLLETARR